MCQMEAKVKAKRAAAKEAAERKEQREKAEAESKHAKARQPRPPPPGAGPGGRPNAAGAKARRAAGARPAARRAAPGKPAAPKVAKEVLRAKALIGKVNAALAQADTQAAREELARMRALAESEPILVKGGLTPEVLEQLQVTIDTMPSAAMQAREP